MESPSHSFIFYSPQDSKRNYSAAYAAFDRTRLTMPNTSTIAVATSPAQQMTVSCLVGSKDAMKYLNVSRSTLLRMINKGVIKASKLGKCWKFKVEDLVSAPVPLSA